jgi:hypothetical protein
MNTSARSKTLISWSIMVSITLFSLVMSGFIVDTAISDSRNNATLLADFLHVCIPVKEVGNTERIAVLRLDDVQAYGWTDIAIKMMDDAAKRGMPVAAGVIPKDLSTDPRIVKYLKQNDCNLEIAMHGYDHGLASDMDTETPEFGMLSAAEAIRRVDDSLRILRRITDQKIVTFIPPQNRISVAAADAITVRGLTILSAEGENTYDYHAATWNFSDDSFVPATAVLLQCEVAWEEGPLCVIMLHPQDFAAADGSIDEERYKHYISLLNGLRIRHAAVMTFARAADFVE